MILSLDVSSTRTGYALFNVDGTLVRSGHFSGDNLLSFYSAVCLLLTADVVGVVCEQIYCGINKNTFKVLAKLQAIVQLACEQRSIQLQLVSAVQWRAALGWPRLKRAEAKAKAIATVEELYGIVTNDDEAEAVCLALAYFKENL